MMNRTVFAMPEGTISVCHWHDNVGSDDAGNEDAAFAPSGARPILHWAHANGFNGQTYDRLLAPLAAHYDVYAWDARGHGHTQLPANPLDMTSWQIYADDLEKLVLRLHEKSGRKIWLGGHSMGGCASVLLAAKRPDLVAGLVLADPVIIPTVAGYIANLLTRLRGRGHKLMELAKRRRRDWPNAAVVEKAYSGRGAFASWQDGFLQSYLAGGLLPILDAEMDDSDNEVRLACDPQWEAANFKGPQMNVTKHIRRLQVPLTLLMAQKGSTTRAAWAFHRLGVDKKIETVPNSSHFVPMEFPEIMRDEIIARIDG